MIFYFSGTGNTRWAARLLAEATRERLLFIPNELAVATTAGTEFNLSYTLAPDETVGFAFPVYAWGPPVLVTDFIARLDLQGYNGQYCFSLCTCGDDMGRTREILSRALAQKHIRLDAGFFLTMPDCYVALPGFDVDSNAERTEKLEKAPGQLQHIIQTIRSRRRQHFEEKPGSFPSFKSYVIRPFFNRFLITDRLFHTDDRCISCSRCAKACPVGNIVMEKGAPHWTGHCTGCLACYHHCPTHSLQFGKRTTGKGQYLHDKYVKQ